MSFLGFPGIFEGEGGVQCDGNCRSRPNEPRQDYWFRCKLCNHQGRVDFELDLLGNSCPACSGPRHVKISERYGPWGMFRRKRAVFNITYFFKQSPQSDAD